MNRGVRVVMSGGLVMALAVGWAASAAAQGLSASPAPMDPVADVQALRERAAAFWAARVAGDSRAQWELLEPRARGRVTAEEFRGDGGSLRYLAYQVEEAAVNGFFATVKVRVLFQPILPLSGPGRIPVQVAVADDGWIRIGGVWYRRLDEGPSGPSQARQP